MYEMYEARNSLYCYPGTEVLKNKMNIQNQKELLFYESKITAAKLLQLRQKGITGNFNISHFTSIHKEIFEDLYEFAGLFRTENIAKDNFRFAEWEFIEEQLKEILEKLKKEDYLAGNTKEKLAKRLAYYMAELNVLHPFRDGNGRTTREFIRQLALKNGYNLNLANVQTSDIYHASIRSVANTDTLEEVLYKCLQEKVEKD